MPLTWKAQAITSDTVVKILGADSPNGNALSTSMLPSQTDGGPEGEWIPGGMPASDQA